VWGHHGCPKSIKCLFTFISFRLQCFTCLHPIFPSSLYFFLLFFCTNWPRLHYSRDVSRIGQICLVSSWSRETTGWSVKTEDKQGDSLSCERSCVPPTHTSYSTSFNNSRWVQHSSLPYSITSLHCTIWCTHIINRATTQFLLWAFTIFLQF
jgi:hypothetical protein